MKIAFYGSSLLSAYWNGAATYYRGHAAATCASAATAITFYEPDAFDRQQHRDIDPPDWAEVVVYPATTEAAAARARADAARRRRGGQGQRRRRVRRRAAGGACMAAARPRRACASSGTWTRPPRWPSCARDADHPLRRRCPR